MMRVAQTVFGVFHHFELARELERQGLLDRVFSTWPWYRLQREGIAKARVETFPWLHLAEMAANRWTPGLPSLGDCLGYGNALAFDWWTHQRLSRERAPDALIAISGSSLKTGKALKARGSVFVCDRGSSHQRFQTELIEEENKIWGIDARVSDPRDTAREEEIYAVADAISVPSTFAANSFRTMGVPPAKIHVIPYGVLVDQFKRKEGCQPPDIGQRLEILFAGQVSLRKGIPYLLQAFSNVKHPSKHLTVAGHMNSDIRALLSSLPVENVTFLGSVSRAKLIQLMSQSHALVLPSIEDGFGLVMAQAMACGCPVIASTNTGGGDLFVNGKEGLLVPIRDPTAIATCLGLMIDDPLTQTRMSNEAQARVSSIGGWRRYGEQWSSLLRNLTGLTEHDSSEIGDL